MFPFVLPCPAQRKGSSVRQKACEEVVLECESLLSLRDLVGLFVFFWSDEITVIFSGDLGRFSGDFTAFSVDFMGILFEYSLSYCDI